jgi:hypothetical protein
MVVVSTILELFPSAVCICRISFVTLVRGWTVEME